MISLLVTIVLLLRSTDIDLFLFFLISATYPLFPSYALSKKLLRVCLINDVKFELLNDFPLEKINTASSMLVLPDPFAP